jgi:tRNA pseudouridine13 synthase
MPCLFATRLLRAACVKIKQRPEDFVVREGYRFESDPNGSVWVYRMDKQKVSTLQALERISKDFGVRRRHLSVCGLKDKQGRTEQLVGVLGGSLGETEVVQSGDLRLQLIGRTAQPLTSGNITANRFEVTVRDLSPEEAARVPESAAEVQRAGVVNYFDSQRFGFLKHGQGFIAKHLVRGEWEAALRAFLATPSELDKSDDAKVKQFWKDHWGQWQLRAPLDAGKRYAPVLRRLREDPRDFRGAFLHIDRRIRMMALFELQSYVWNEGVKRYLGSRVPAAEMVGLRYQAGALIFPRALPRELRDELWSRTFPLLAPDSKFEDSAIEQAALGALRSQGLTLADLEVPETRQLFFKHEERPLFVVPGKLRVHPARPDEVNRRRMKVNLSFTLPPGAYATLVVRRVMWFAGQSRQEPKPVGRALGQPLEEVRPPPPPEKPKQEKLGFLERQRRSKAARSTRRAAAKKH